MDRKTVKSERTTAPKTAKRVTKTTLTTNTTDVVAARAYEYFVARGMEHGHDVEDWLRAESELAPKRR